jgi:superfamily II DNA helicase RecQ
MNVEDTNKNNGEQECSICGIMKLKEQIVKNRKLCKQCNNMKKTEKVKEKLKNLDKTLNKTCSVCNTEKIITSFSRDGLSNICIDCSNVKRRTKYNNNEETRKKAVKQATEFKQKKKAIRDEIKQAELEKLEKEIGQENTICKYCKEVKPKTRFRHNRLKCKDCERDDPEQIFQKRTRSRIHNCLFKNKSTCEYLGCSRDEYIKWLTNNDKGYTLENYGTDWHIDHVIPLSRFNLKNEEDITLAFNWRNTMPLAAKENLSKNNKILIPQIKDHFKKLTKYHKDNNILLPQKFIKLYAKHLEAGTP